MRKLVLISAPSPSNWVPRRHNGSSAAAADLGIEFIDMNMMPEETRIDWSVDTRDGADVIRSRIGLQHKAQIIHPEDDIIKAYHEAGDFDVVIADEAQFLTPEQIDGLRWLVDEKNIPVLCFGLRTDFLTHFFPGAKRLMELADSITEIKTICECGRKATVNARFDENGRIITEGDQVMLGGNDRYTAMCHRCWVNKIKEQKLCQ